MQKQTFDRLVNLAGPNNLVCLQETHGHDGDLVSLETEFPALCSFGSFCSEPNAGGNVIMISRAPRSLLPNALHVELIPGRLHA
eukprot:6227046-Pyramimonas_sp.AAC.1